MGVAREIIAGACSGKKWASADAIDNMTAPTVTRLPIMIGGLPSTVIFMYLTSVFKCYIIRCEQKPPRLVVQVGI